MCENHSRKKLSRDSFVKVRKFDIFHERRCEKLSNLKLTEQIGIKRLQGNFYEYNFYNFRDFLGPKGRFSSKL